MSRILKKIIYLTILFLITTSFYFNYKEVESFYNFPSGNTTIDAGYNVINSPATNEPYPTGKGSAGGWVQQEKNETINNIHIGIFRNGTVETNYYLKIYEMPNGATTTPLTDGTLISTSNVFTATKANTVLTYAEQTTKETIVLQEFTLPTGINLITGKYYFLLLTTETAPPNAPSAHSLGWLDIRTTDLNYQGLYSSRVNADGTHGMRSNDIIAVTGFVKPPTNSRIVEMLPVDGAVVNNSFTASLSYYINSEDLGFWQDFKVDWILRKQPISGSITQLYYHSVDEYDKIVATSTDLILTDGNYIIDVVISKCYLSSLFCLTHESLFHQFVVVEGTLTGDIFQAGISYIEPFIDEMSTTTFARFVNVPHLLKTKAPFSYLYGIGTILNEGLNTPATTTQTLTLTLVDQNSTSTPAVIKSALKDMEFFSETTITKYFPAWLINVFKNLIIAVVWTGAGFAVFAMIRKEIFPT